MAKSKDYWDKRHIQWIKNQDKADDVIANRLEKDYKRVARDLENDIAGYFKRYGKDDVLKYRTMLQDLSKKDKDLLYQDMEAFAEKYPKYEHLMPVRESVYKLNRIQGLHYSTELKLLELGAIEQSEFEKHLLNTYGENYKALMSELGMGETFNAMNDEIAKNTIFTKWVDDKNFSDRIWINKEKLMNQLRNNYRDALVRGDSYDKMTAMIVKRLGVGAYDARRLVWTESSFVLNQSHTRPYIDVGVEEYELNAILDSRTSVICRELDGEVFRFDEMVVGENFPPLHTWCRTTFIGKNLDELLNKDIEPSPSDIQVDLNDTITSKLTDDEIDEIKNKLSNAPPEIQTMFNKYMKDIDWAETSKGDYYHPATRKIYMKTKSLKGEDREDYATLFHEFAHNIDSVAGEKEFGDRFKFMSTYYSDDFTNLIKKDADNYIKLQQKRLKDAVKEQWIGDEFSQEIFLDNDKYIIFDKKAAKRDGKNVVRDQLINGDLKEVSSISDIFEGSSSIYSKSGHGKNYWKKKDNLSREAFAHMTEATITNKESLHEIKKHFPNAYKEYLEIVKRINGV